MFFIILTARFKYMILNTLFFTFRFCLSDKWVFINSTWYRVNNKQNFHKLVFVNRLNSFFKSIFILLLKYTIGIPFNFNFFHIFFWYGKTFILVCLIYCMILNYSSFKNRYFKRISNWLYSFSERANKLKEYFLSVNGSPAFNYKLLFNTVLILAEPR